LKAISIVGIPVITRYKNDPINKISIIIPKVSPILSLKELGRSIYGANFFNRLIFISIDLKVFTAFPWYFIPTVFILINVSQNYNLPSDS
jgi:hypothetical protein